MQVFVTILSVSVSSAIVFQYISLGEQAGYHVFFKSLLSFLEWTPKQLISSSIKLTLDGF